MGQSPIRITIVGGGVYAPRLCEALARAIQSDAVELRLSARDRERLRVLAAHADSLVRGIRPGWSVAASTPLDGALEGAALVILLARVGGFAARSWDEEFPRRYGLVGDEGLGPGGIANAWRTVPELARIADAIGRMAPDARILNLMAPLGITTRLLLDRGLDAVGVCELPTVTLERWLALAGVPAGNTRWQYGGLNHLGWFWGVDSDGRDLLPALADQEELARDGFPIDGPTLERFGAAPLRYYYEIFDPPARARAGLERRPGRARELFMLAERLLGRFAAKPGANPPEADRRETPWLDLAVAPIASAMLGGPAHEGFANVRNEGMIPGLGPELVVEVPATYASGITTVRPHGMPGAVKEFLRGAGEAETLTYEAATRRDPDLLIDALRALPLGIEDGAARELGKFVRTDPEALSP